MNRFVKLLWIAMIRYMSKTFPAVMLKLELFWSIRQRIFQGLEYSCALHKTSIPLKIIEEI